MCALVEQWQIRVGWPLLQFEQDAFTFQTAAIACEASAGTYDTVARHDDCDRVPAVGQPHCAPRTGGADLFGDFSIGPCLSIRNRQQRRPNSPLELGTPQVDVKVEGDELPGEVGPELFDGVFERCGVR